jgi:Oxysterol-binding protein
MTLRCLNAIPQGANVITFKKSGDTIVVRKAVTHVYNLIMGEMFIHHSGILKAENVTTGDTLEIDLKEKPFFGDPESSYIGWVKDSNGEVKYNLRGDWKTHLEAVHPITDEVTMIVEKNPDPEEFDEQYRFPMFSRNLNHINVQTLRKICPTDSRLRPDQRALENGDEDLSQEEKLRLEDKQRKKRS